TNQPLHSLPRSSRVPYTTLFRSRCHSPPPSTPPPRRRRHGPCTSCRRPQSRLAPCARASRPCCACSARRSPKPKTRRSSSTPRRSEEHTSELQSRFDLVCRLLLE